MSTLNVPLARKVLEYIEAHPEEHYQGAFAAEQECGTTLCIAGHALLLSGRYALTSPADGLWQYDFVDTLDRRRIVVPDEAGAEVMGLDVLQRERLFMNLQDEAEALDYLRELIEDAEK